MSRPREEQLTRWNVKAGMRVGMFAPNSYAYMVYDLALMDCAPLPCPSPTISLAALNPRTGRPI